MIGGHGARYGFYIDRRRGGEERWSLGLPRDALMRVPDDLLTCPLFFGGRDSGGHLHYRATAFFIIAPTERRDLGALCLVTARHNVERAIAEYGNVWVRLNTRDGAARDVEITKEWTYPDNPASDIAVVPWPWEKYEWEALPIPLRWFVTEDTIEREGVGVGEDLIVMGLFSHHVGTKRNLPIVRSGNIASMPHEPLIDDATGDEYDAYLAEVRSIGGLSGSPVFVTTVGPRPADLGTGEAFAYYLLGLVRGHWTHDTERDFRGTEADRLNTGIAIVTPITELLPLLERDEFVRHRKDTDKEIDRASGGRQVKDMAEESEGDEFARFEGLTRKLVNVPKKELDEKRKRES